MEGGGQGGYPLNLQCLLDRSVPASESTTTSTISRRLVRTGLEPRLRCNFVLYSHALTEDQFFTPGSNAPRFKSVTKGKPLTIPLPE
eukprot:753466-Hanusia_phi.AAC.3